MCCFNLSSFLFCRLAVAEKENMYRKMALNLDEQLQIQRQTQEELEQERSGLIKLIKEMNDEVDIHIKNRDQMIQHAQS
jgi:hypothetical protein